MYGFSLTKIWALFDIWGFMDQILKLLMHKKQSFSEAVVCCARAGETELKEFPFYPGSDAAVL